MCVRADCRGAVVSHAVSDYSALASKRSGITAADARQIGESPDLPTKNTKLNCTLL